MDRILIVEDERNQRELYRREFAEEGYAVEVAEDTASALRRVETERPDLVILDLNMPGPSGMDCLEELLARDPRLPVVLNTAYGTFKDDFRSWAATSYVIKSSDLTELKDAVRSALARLRPAERAD
ncbi:MAG: response regulator [Planctomycetes bacterium]|nr:response regulator [Planctomycetota bacterium]